MKNILRQQAKELRKKLDTTGLSVRLTALIRRNEVYKSAGHVLLYYPLKYEMNFLDLLKDSKKFYFPRVDGNKMLVCPYDNGVKLEKSSFGIYEPCSKPCSPSIIDVAIVPSLAVDRNGNRLGYGGGFYDRFLAQNRNIKTICALPESLVLNEIPSEPFDIAVDIVLKTS